MPYMLTADGRPMSERVRDLLPAPSDNVVALEPRKDNGR
jgi:hypothetical protein